jgi:hypothetical protein
MVFASKERLRERRKQRKIKLKGNGFCVSLGCKARSATTRYAGRDSEGRRTPRIETPLAAAGHLAYRPEFLPDHMELTAC